MSDFQVVANSICCGAGARSFAFTYRYAIGSFLYSIDKANKGILELVVIKDIRLVNNRKTFGRTIPLYIDTFNALWNEGDLCTESVARELAIDYLELEQARYEQAISRCAT